MFVLQILVTIITKKNAKVKIIQNAALRELAEFRQMEFQPAEHNLLRNRNSYCRFYGFRHIINISPA